MIAKYDALARGGYRPAMSLAKKVKAIDYALEDEERAVEAGTITAADWAGVSRMKYFPYVRILRVMCAGRADPEFVVAAF